ncbi:MAG: hypothetical protein HFF18_04130 [Oscillospiraceae bacterium]|nr:hypothetical protein [Oscillospiraceae bacterium]
MSGLKRIRWNQAALMCAVLLMACCLTACGGKLPAGVTTALGDLSGLSQEEAVAQLNDAFEAVQGQNLTLRYNGMTAALPGSSFQLDDLTGLLEDVEQGEKLELPVSLSGSGEQNLQNALEQLSGGDSVVDTICAVLDGELVITKGVTGVSVSEGDALDAARSAVMKAVNQAVNEAGSLEQAAVDLEGTTVAPGEPDLEKLYQEIYTEPVDARLDPDAGQIVPHANGVSFDIAQVREEIADMEEGGTKAIPLTETEPAITTAKLEANLFKDVLGQASSNVGGSAARLSNVALAASMCNGKILMPGDIFAYNETTGPRTLAAGFKNAPAYVNGRTEDQVGGGICQVSSTTYYAVLRANLKVVERQNHSYAVGYVPDGMDATVFYGSLDFRFQNDTNYPIKLLFNVDGRKLTVTIMGTNETGYTYEVWNKLLSTVAPEVIEKEDPSLQPGESRVDQTAYTGKRVEVYRGTYDKDGNLISTEKISTDTYKKRDKIVLVGPALVDPTAPLDPNLPVDPNASVDPNVPVDPSAPVVDPPVQESPLPPVQTAAPSTEPVPSVEPSLPPEPSVPPSTEPSSGVPDILQPPVQTQAPVVPEQPVTPEQPDVPPPPPAS